MEGNRVTQTLSYKIIKKLITFSYSKMVDEEEQERTSNGKWFHVLLPQEQCEDQDMDVHQRMAVQSQADHFQ